MTQALREALQLCVTRWHDLAQIIRENGSYTDAGFCEATAKRCESALASQSPSIADLPPPDFMRNVGGYTAPYYSAFTVRQLLDAAHTRAERLGPRHRPAHLELKGFEAGWNARQAAQPEAAVQSAEPVAWRIVLAAGIGYSDNLPYPEAAAHGWQPLYAQPLTPSADLKDAQRYRWLRANPEWLGWEHDFRPDEVEREIDRAMLSSAPKEK